MTTSAVRNLEVKARAVQGFPPLRRVLEERGGKLQWVRQQVDTFYRVPAGRLKLREEYEDDRLSSAQLIPYFRPDQPDPKESSYVVIPVAAPDALRELLDRMLGVKGVVRKTREFWLLYGDSLRVHLDTVEGLGEFVEIEAILGLATPTSGSVPTLGALSPAEFAALQSSRTAQLVTDLYIEAEHLIGTAYLEMLTPPPRAP
jgi:adenylate cyclase class IV